jgi:long-chain acyl-CoA synthetase
MYETRPWLSRYSTGVPANIDPDQYPTLLALMEESMKKYASLPMFISMDKTLTYAEIDKMSYQMAAYFQSRGLEPGDRLAIMMPNLLQYPIAVIGALRAGLIVVNTNPLYTPREMLHQFTDSGCKGIVICDNYCSNLQGILAQTAIKVVVRTSIGEMLPMVKGAITNFVVRNVKKMVPKYELDNAIPFKVALEQGKAYKVTAPAGSGEDIVLIQYTGGTTGVAKGAMLTNRNMMANMLQIRAILSPRMAEKTGIALCPLPMYHVFAYSVNLLALATYGIPNVLVLNPRDIGSVLKEFKKRDITIMTGVNTLYNSLNNHPDSPNSNLGHLQICVSGAMALQRSVAEKWQQMTGCAVVEGYGMTESAPVASVNPIDGSGPIGLIGFPVPNTMMRIVDPEGVPVPVGETGEIQIHGPQVMKGYWNRPDETAIALKDGWLCTGDVGLMQEDGYFKIVDRLKDMILVSGFNVYPNEIEEIVCMHPKVLECAAVGLIDEKSGESVKIFVVKKDNSLTEAELMDHCRKNLTPYKLPRKVEFRNELPKTNVGKVLRRELRDQK